MEKALIGQGNGAIHELLVVLTGARGTNSNAKSVKSRSAPNRGTRFAFLMLDGTRVTRQVGLFGRNRDFQRAHAILSRNARRKTVQHVVNKIAQFNEISICKTA